MVIQESFFTLLRQRPIEQITVADICRGAGINRATFYRHYENPYDLLSTLENEMLEDIKQSAYEYGGDVDKLMEVIFCKFVENKETWSLLLSDHADLSFLYKIYHFFDDYFQKGNMTKERDLRYRFLLYGYSGIFDYWVKTGMAESPKEMANYLKKFRHDLIRNK